jgi:hypothetical protein
MIVTAFGLQVIYLFKAQHENYQRIQHQGKAAFCPHNVLVQRDF